MLERFGIRDTAARVIQTVDNSLFHYGREIRRRQYLAQERKREQFFNRNSGRITDLLNQIDDTLIEARVARSEAEVTDYPLLDKRIAELEVQRGLMVELLPRGELSGDLDRIFRRNQRIDALLKPATPIVVDREPPASVVEPIALPIPPLSPPQQVITAPPVPEEVAETVEPEELVNEPIEEWVREPIVLHRIRGGTNALIDDRYRLSDRARVVPIDEAVVLPGNAVFDRGRNKRVLFRNPVYANRSGWQRFRDRLFGRDYLRGYQRLKSDEAIIVEEKDDDETIHSVPYVDERRIYDSGAPVAAFIAGVGIASVAWWGAHQTDSVREHIHLGKFDLPHSLTNSVNRPAAALPPQVAVTPPTNPDTQLVIDQILHQLQPEVDQWRNSIAEEGARTRTAIQQEGARIEALLRAAADRNRAANGGEISQRRPILQDNERRDYIFRDADQKIKDSVQQKSVTVQNAKGNTFEIPIEQTSSLRGRAEAWWMNVVYDKEGKKGVFDPYSKDAQKELQQAINKYGGSEKFNKEVQALVNYMYWATQKEYQGQESPFFELRKDNSVADILVLHKMLPSDGGTLGQGNMVRLVEPKGADEAKKIIDFARKNTAETFKESV